MSAAAAAAAKLNVEFSFAMKTEILLFFLCVCFEKDFALHEFLTIILGVVADDIDGFEEFEIIIFRLWPCHRFVGNGWTYYSMRSE